MRFYHLAAVLTLCLSAIGSSSVRPGAPDLSALSLTWVAGPALPAPRSNAAAVVGSDGRIIVPGGTTVNPATVFTLLPEATSWAAAAALPQARFAPGAALLPNGRVMVFGGKSTKVLKDSISYDPLTNSFGSIRSLSGPRYLHAFTRDTSGNVYAIGGKDDLEQELALVERYSPYTDRWATLAPLPEARSGVAAASDGGDHVLTFGGVVGGAASATVNRYTVSTGAWSLAAPMPVPTQHSAAVLGANGLIYVVGGISNGAPINAVQIYKIADDSWMLGTPLPAALSAASLVIDAQGRLVVIGGVDANNASVAAVWLSPQADAPPIIVTTPATFATVGQAYGYQVNASGKPAPNYLLTAEPAGMTINGDSGLISWTPTAAQIGNQTVAVKAYNTAGDAQQTFTIAVAPPTPAAPTGLAVSNVTANGATLTWNAVTGATSYRIFEVFCGGRSGCRSVLTFDAIAATSLNITGLVSGSGHRYAVAAVGAGVQSAGSLNVSFVTLQPAAPTNVIVANLTQTSVTLSWLPQGSAVPIAGYRIYEFINGQFALRLDGISGNSATVTGLLTNTTHTFYVVSVDAISNQSPFTAQVTFKTISLPAPFHTPVFAPPFTEQVVAVVGDKLMLISPEAHSAAGADYLVSATNFPQPVFSIAAGPPGMTVDPVTGKVTWTPVTAPAGTFNATVRATNNVGSGDFTFSYTVYPAGTDLLSPAEVPYAQVLPGNVTSTSATISWPASVDNVGVAGYYVYTQTPPFIGCTGCGPGGPIVKAATTTGPATSTLAMKCYQRAVELDPQNEGAVMALKKLREKK